MILRYKIGSNNFKNIIPWNVLRKMVRSALILYFILTFGGTDAAHGKHVPLAGVTGHKIRPGVGTGQFTSRLYQSELLKILKERLNSSPDLLLLRRLCASKDGYKSAATIMARIHPAVSHRAVSGRFSSFKKFHQRKMQRE